MPQLSRSLRRHLPTQISRCACAVVQVSIQFITVWHLQSLLQPLDFADSPSHLLALIKGSITYRVSLGMGKLLAPKFLLGKDSGRREAMTRDSRQQSRLCNR